MTVLDDIKKARELFANAPKHLQREFMGRFNEGDAYIRCTSKIDPTNNCFCMAGVLHHVTNTPIYVWLSQAIVDPFGMSESEMYKFNDTHTKEEVLALFDEAIARMEADNAA